MSFFSTAAASPSPLHPERAPDDHLTGSGQAVAARPSPPRVSVVLPVFNEEAAIEPLTSAVLDCVERAHARCELIFVNDGSTDDSGPELDRLAACDPRVRVVHLSRNFGHQAAVQAGLSLAEGDAVVVMDCDMQDAPEALPEFIAAWRDGFDVVYAIRTDRKEGAIKRSAFVAFYRLLAAISDTPMPLDAGNFGLIDGRVARRIAALGERDRYFPGLRSWLGFRQIGIPVERHARYDDHPRVSWWGLVRLAKTAIFSFSSFPLAAFTAIGLGALGLFLGLSCFSLGCKLFTALAIPGWTSNVLIGCFFGALNALGIAMLGEYVIRIYDQVRGRPLFVVDRTVNFGASLANFGASNIAESRAIDASRETPLADTLPPGQGDDPAEELLAATRALSRAARQVVRKKRRSTTDAKRAKTKAKRRAK